MQPTMRFAAVSTLCILVAAACASSGTDTAPGDNGTPNGPNGPNGHLGGDGGDASIATTDDSGTPGATDSGLVDGAPNPNSTCQTQYLNPKNYLAGVVDPDWFVRNIPFLDVPDAITTSRIQSVYYYRFETLRRALRYTDAANGYVFLEFLEPPGYAAAFGAVNAAAGHHLYESRWLHDSRYGDDYLKYWLFGAGKPNVRQYSFWVANSAWARYQTSGDAAFVGSLLGALEENFDGWSDHYDSAMGLYFQTPVWDAMEYMADSYSSQNPDKDAYHGGTGYRPTINAYQYADARAIASLLRLTGDATKAATYDAKAEALVTAMQTHLWAPESNFFVHKYKDGGALFSAGGGREEIGFVPWQFDMPKPGYEATWRDTIMNPAAFFTKYGPTTVAKDNPYYLQPYAKGQCCHWNGPLWPYSTTQTLVAMANLIDDYQQSYVTAADYFSLLDAYAKSQFKNGVPYVAEALDPDDTSAPIWTYDSPGHSEHYNHSGFVDPVITGLIGLRPSADDVVHLKPLVPAAWDHFMLENVAYHGHSLTIAWDADGSHYGAGAGFTLFEDCSVIHHQATLGAVDVPLANGTRKPVAQARPNNIFSNAANGAFPKASASYTWNGDDAAQMIDGLVIYDRSVNGSPNDGAMHNRWTNYGSKNQVDWVQVDLGSAKTFGEVTLHLYDDGGGVTSEAGYALATSNDGTAWTPVSNPQKTGPTTAAGPHVVTFDAVTSRYFRVTFDANPKCVAGTGCSGITELEAWVNP